MEPYKERVIEEKKDLDTKLEKLTSFIDDEIFQKLVPVEQSRLRRQLDAMKLYSDVLRERIDAFTS